MEVNGDRRLRIKKRTYHKAGTEKPFYMTQQSCRTPMHGLRSRDATCRFTGSWSWERKAGNTKGCDSSITIYNQGVELMLAKRFPEAEAKLEQAVKENPRFADAHNNLGYTLRKRSGKLPEIAGTLRHRDPAEAQVVRGLYVSGCSLHQDGTQK
jgi:tetratricopeptide (TPR) repeat protein